MLVGIGANEAFRKELAFVNLSGSPLPTDYRQWKKNRLIRLRPNPHLCPWCCRARQHAIERRPKVMALTRRAMEIGKKMDGASIFEIDVYAWRMVVVVRWRRFLPRRIRWHLCSSEVVFREQ